MTKIYENISSLIGNTPLVRLNNYNNIYNKDTSILAKLEYLNPTGSIKDRVALAIIEDAEKKGLLKPGSVILEPTSGNTGIGLAAIAASKGYKSIMIMPSSMSIERIKLIKAYGADVILTPAEQGMAGSVEKAEALVRESSKYFIAGQFENPVNPEAHYLNTGKEIYNDTDGNVDIFIATVGTGGTLSGTAKYLKEKIKTIKIVAVEPASSPLLSEGKSGPHGIQGIGANFIPKTLDTDIYDEIIKVTEEDAYNKGRAVSACEGYLVGISSGAALHAATVIANRPENKGKNIVVILPDSGDRYLSTPLFS